LKQLEIDSRNAWPFLPRIEAFIARCGRNIK